MVAAKDPPAGAGKQRKSNDAQLAVPTTPLKRGSALLKTMNKYVCHIKGILLRMNTLKYQSEIKQRLVHVSDSVEGLFQQLSRLVKDKTDTQEPYDPILKQFVDLKAVAEDDILEAEGVVEAAGRPAKRAAPAAGKRVKKEAS